jgi:hypothetical protein
MDQNHRYIVKKYQSNKDHFKNRGFYLGRTPLALITKDKDGRKKYAYHDMDYYSDNDQSAWRPWITIDQLKKKPNFQYLGGYLVKKFHEKEDHIEVECLDLKNQTSKTFRCRKLILATSALGSGRIVLRSQGQPDSRLPLLCNPYTYIPCIQPKFVGRAAEPKKLGFTQLSLFLDKDNQNSATSVASLYSYQSLMLFRIIRHVPLDFSDARILMQYLMSGIVIMGIHHPDSASRHKYIELKESADSATGDVLKISYRLDRNQSKTNQAREKAFIKAMRKMGTYGLKQIDPGDGASIHYAGTIPFSSKEEPLTLAPNGRLHGTKNVFVADSSGFRYLPAPGLTFSIMANAHNVAQGILEHAH